MKKYLVPGLLVSYLIYLGFVQATIAHSIIFLALASLFGFQEFLTRPEKHNYKQMLEQLEFKFQTLLAKQKEEADAKLASVEAEVTKLSLTAMKASASTPAKREEKKIIF